MRKKTFKSLENINLKKKENKTKEKRKRNIKEKRKERNRENKKTLIKSSLGLHSIGKTINILPNCAKLFVCVETFVG